MATGKPHSRYGPLSYHDPTDQLAIHSPFLCATLIRLLKSVDFTRSSKHDNDTKFVILVNYMFPPLCGFIIIIDS